jgi:cysteinyl-tRNA synthetase
MLSLYNTLTRRIDPIAPLKDRRIGFYACGPTVYQRAHIGNLRAYIFEDVLRRTLESIEGFDVKHVMNITDVGHLVGDEDSGEDKVEQSAREQGKDAWEISREYTEQFFADLGALNILKPTVSPKATDHIEEQISLIKILEDKGFAYKTSDGLYFDTSKLPSYGSFGGQKLEEKEEGARIEVNREKRNPSDFALWKFSPQNGPKRQMKWGSPWGVGFPGWHIECSAMSRKELGQPFDIHAGGVDHIPVHHENEIAQSEAAFGVPLARAWMHVEFLMVDGRKMSKSLGNTYLIDDVIEHGIPPLAYRLFILGAHYRTKQNFTWEAASGAKNAYDRLVRAARTWDAPGSEGAAAVEERFRNAMLDDLNTPEALASVWALVDGDDEGSAKSASLLFMDKVLGLGLGEIIAKPIEIPGEIKSIAERRWEARKNGDWDEADRLREDLSGKGWRMLDGKESYSLEREDIQ